MKLNEQLAAKCTHFGLFRKEFNYDTQSLIHIVYGTVMEISPIYKSNTLLLLMANNKGEA